MKFEIMFLNWQNIDSTFVTTFFENWKKNKWILRNKQSKRASNNWIFFVFTYWFDCIDWKKWTEFWKFSNKNFLRFWFDRLRRRWFRRSKWTLNWRVFCRIWYSFECNEWKMWIFWCNDDFENHDRFEFLSWCCSKNIEFLRNKRTCNYRHFHCFTY